MTPPSKVRLTAKNRKLDSYACHFAVLSKKMIFILLFKKKKLHKPMLAHTFIKKQPSEMCQALPWSTNFFIGV